MKHQSTSYRVERGAFVVFRTRGKLVVGRLINYSPPKCEIIQNNLEEFPLKVSDIEVLECEEVVKINLSHSSIMFDGGYVRKLEFCEFRGNVLF